MKTKLLLGLILAIFLPVVSASAEWAGYNWRVTSPVTTVQLYDSTPFPALVQTVVNNWNQTPGFQLNYHQVTSCNPKGGSIYVCGIHPSGVAACSWTTLLLNGKANSNIREAVVTLNLDCSAWQYSTGQYLVCHEMGGGLGLLEKAWPAYLPDGTLDQYHHGCMNLEFQDVIPSRADLDTLTSLYH